MKNSTLIAAAALSLFAVAGVAQAETYDGVLQFNSVLSRAEVHTQGVAAAHAPNPNYALESKTLPALTAPTDRALVRGEAVAAAHAPAQNLRAEAFVNSTIPAANSTNRRVTRQAAL